MTWINMRAGLKTELQWEEDSGKIKEVRGEWGRGGDWDDEQDSSFGRRRKKEEIKLWRRGITRHETR